MYGGILLLWQEEGYMLKYSLSTRELPRAEPNGFPEGSSYILPYIPTWVIIQTFSISKSYTSVLSCLVAKYWKQWFSILVWKLELYFPVLPSRWSNIVPYIPSRELWHHSEIHMVRRAILEELDFNIILFSNWECLRVYQAGSSLGWLEPKSSSWAGLAWLGDKVKIRAWLR